MLFRSEAPPAPVPVPAPVETKAPAPAREASPAPGGHGSPSRPGRPAPAAPAPEAQIHVNDLRLIPAASGEELWAVPSGRAPMRIGRTDDPRLAEAVAQVRRATAPAATFSPVNTAAAVGLGPLVAGAGAPTERTPQQAAALLQASADAMASIPAMLASFAALGVKVTITFST